MAEYALLPHFTDGKTEVQEGLVTCLEAPLPPYVCWVPYIGFLVFSFYLSKTSCLKQLFSLAHNLFRETEGGVYLQTGRGLTNKFMVKKAQFLKVCDHTPPKESPRALRPFTSP